VTCGRAWMELKLNIALRTDGRIHQGLENSLEALRENVADLLQKAGQTIKDWVKTPLYQKYHKGIALSTLWRLKTEILRTLVARKQEVTNLHTSSSLGFCSSSMCLTSR